MIPFNRELSLKLDEALVLLEAAISPELKAILAVRKNMIERHIFELFAQKHNPAPRPSDAEWENIRKGILQRDDHQCKLCLCRDTTLDVHHLIPVEQGGEAMQSNLLTLCRRCHGIIHPWILGVDYATD